MKRKAKKTSISPELTAAPRKWNINRNVYSGFLIYTTYNDGLRGAGTEGPKPQCSSQSMRHEGDKETAKAEVYRESEGSRWYRNESWRRERGVLLPGSESKH